MSLPLWSQTSEALPRPRPPSLVADADVLVVGAGIAGLTAALLLQKAGKRVVLIDAGSVAGGDTSRTTAHLTEVLDTRYAELERTFGRAGAQLAAESSRAAIDMIEQLASGLSAPSGFRRVPGFLFARTAAQRDELQQEFAALQRVGARVSWQNELPPPFECTGAVRIDGQAQLNPIEYLRSLLQSFEDAGGRVFEHTAMLDVESGDPCSVTTERGILQARDVLVLTHAPTVNKVALHTKLAAYRTYVVAYRLDRDFPPGLFWDMEKPYHYVRTERVGGTDFAILGGEDHKTGTDAESERHLSNLSAYAQSLGLQGAPAYGWSGQVIEPSDGLPLIGLNPGSSHIYVASGFSGNGMTFGTLAAMMLRDAVLGLANRFGDFYDPRRLRPFAQARYYAENADFPATLLKDRLQRGEVESMDEVPRGAGRLMRSGRKMLAVYRDEGGRLHTRSAACTHLGCYVRWNPAEQSWDCPCHGSRFDTDGQVLNGPATRALEGTEDRAPAEPSAPRIVR